MMAYFKTFTDAVGFPEYNEAIYTRMLRDLLTLRRKPRVLVIGYGTVGRACIDVFRIFDIPCTIWKHEDKKDKDAIFAHDILINAISLRTGAAREIFLMPQDLDAPTLTRHLSVICDISCDLGNPRNALPIYTEYTTLDQPVRRIHPGNGSSIPPLDLIAVPHLPAMDPIRSSVEFSRAFKDYVGDLSTFRAMRDASPICRALDASDRAFSVHRHRGT